MYWIWRNFINLICRNNKLEVDIIKLLPTLLFTRHEIHRMNKSMKEFADKVVKCSSNNAMHTIQNSTWSSAASNIEIFHMLKFLACFCAILEYVHAFSKSWKEFLQFSLGLKMKMFSGLCMKRAFKVLPIWNFYLLKAATFWAQWTKSDKISDIYEHIDTKLEEKLPMQHKFSQLLLKILLSEHLKELHIYSNFHSFHFTSHKSSIWMNERRNAGSL